MPATNQGLLLDLDGTIVDTLGFLFDAFRHAVAPFVSVVPSNADVVATFGPAEPECLANYLVQCERAGVCKRPAAEVTDEAVERFFRFYEQGDQIRVFPGIPELIHGRKQLGWRVGVFTGKGRRGAEWTLQSLGLLEVVDCLVSSDDVREPKPHPEGVLTALKRLEMAPASLVFVGDAPADIQAGNAARVVTVAALWGAFDPAATLRAGPTRACQTVAELATFLDRHAPMQGLSEPPN